MTKVYIYGLIDPRTNLIRYIGKSINPQQRYYSHINGCKNKRTHKECWLYGLFKDNLTPILTILEECESNWIQREQYHIKSYNNLTNLTEGGEGIGGFIHSEQTKNHMSKNRKGIKNSFYGKNHSQETKNILSKKTSQYLKNNRNPFKNKKHNNKTKKILSDIGKKRWENGTLPVLPIMFGEKNPSTKKRIFISPDENQYIVLNTKKFCNQHSLSYDTVRKHINKGKISLPTEKHILSRQRKKSLNCIGWTIIE